jgi:hypothetical protein
VDGRFEEQPESLPKAEYELEQNELVQC